MAKHHEDLAGRTLANTYAVERLLGKGAMGAVYAARHLRTGGTFAVKVLYSETAADEEIYRRFQNEARIVSALRHPHIVQVTDFDEDDGTPFLVMEYLEGQDLQQRLRQVERLPLGVTLELARQIGSALHAAHQLGVVHRDVKPQNIFLSRHQLTDRVNEVVKVVDFGISKIRHVGSQATQNTAVLGTPYYMSPEAARAQNEDLDGRADQWALAVILYRALSGRLPFNNPDPLAVLYQVVNEQQVPIGQLVPELPGHIAQAIERGLAKSKEDRFDTMADFLHALDGPALDVSPAYAAGAALEEEYDVIEVVDSTLSRATGQVAIAPRWTRRQVLLGAGAAALGLLLVKLWPGAAPARPAAPSPVVAAPAPVPVQVPAVAAGADGGAVDGGGAALARPGVTPAEGPAALPPAPAPDNVPKAPKPKFELDKDI